MTNRMGRLSRGEAHRVVTFAAFALLWLCLPGVASAQWATNGNNISNTNTGNVGIGTPIPSAELHIAAPSTGYEPEVKLEGTIDPGNGATRLAVVNPRSFMGLSAYGSGSPGVLANAGGLFADAPSSALVIGSGSNIPIHIFTNNSYSAPQLTLAASGNLGIGTTTPSAKLHIAAQPTGYEAQVKLEGVVDPGNGATRLAVVNPRAQMALNAYGSGSPGVLANAVGLFAGTPSSALIIGSGNMPIHMFTNDSYTAPHLTLDTHGNVGIGITTPTTKLHVVGDVTVTGNINAKYQDVAEWVPSAQKLSAGTVVVLDPERANQVLASASAYDTSVAGVVSAQPGIALGEKGEGKVLVATTGRVKVRVDASHAAIKIGDLLVTSDVAGVAMKSEPINIGGRRMHAPGTIIGKALEPLEKGTGEILVLLSLQ